MRYAESKTVRKTAKGRIVAAVFAIVGFLVLVHIGFHALTGNFHEVLPGELYRSAQPEGADISQFAKEHGIRSIINLRDEEPGPWLDAEKGAAEREGIELIRFPISSSNGLPAREAHRLAEIMHQAPKPLLIHCEHGSNRTGLASAIYVRSSGKGWLLAEFQVSPYFGHFPIPGVGRFAIYQSWLRFKASQADDNRKL